jgi:hypothetical protein
MSKTIRELAAEKVAEYEATVDASCAKVQLEWLFDTFGFTPADFEREGIVIRFDEKSSYNGFQIMLVSGGWSDIIRHWEGLHAFFEAHPDESDYISKDYFIHSDKKHIIYVAMDAEKP